MCFRSACFAQVRTSLQQNQLTLIYLHPRLRSSAFKDQQHPAILLSGQFPPQLSPKYFWALSNLFFWHHDLTTTCNPSFSIIFQKPISICDNRPRKLSQTIAPRSPQICKISESWILQFITSNQKNRLGSDLTSTPRPLRRTLLPNQALSSSAVSLTVTNLWFIDLTMGPPSDTPSKSHASNNTFRSNHNVSEMKRLWANHHDLSNTRGVEDQHADFLAKVEAMVVGERHSVMAPTSLKRLHEVLDDYKDFNEPTFLGQYSLHLEKKDCIPNAKEVVIPASKPWYRTPPLDHDCYYWSLISLARHWMNVLV